LDLDDTRSALARILSVMLVGSRCVCEGVLERVPADRGIIDADDQLAEAVATISCARL